MKQSITSRTFALLCVVVFSIYPGKNFSQILMTTNSSNTQDFNTLTNTTTVTWVNNSTIPNWYSQRTGTGTTILVSDGTSSGGNLYSYGTTASSERALGTVGSANVAAGNFAHGVLLQNTSGATITDIKVSYTLEQWRFSGATAAQAIDVYYHTSASIDTALTPSNNTGWTQITGLTLSSPIISGVTGPLNGNAVANKVSLSNVPIPSLSLPDNNYIMLKWEDINHAGNDHGLGIDDVTITWTTGSTLPALAITSASMSFGGQTVLTNSASQSDTVSGTNLTGFPDSITIKAPSVDFQVSKDNSTWTDSVNIYYSSATLVKTAFWVRFTPQSGGNKSGINVTVNGGGVAAPTLLAVSGTGLDPVGPAPYTVAGSTYTQNFNGLPNSGGLITLGNVGPNYLSGTPVFAGGVVGWQFGATSGSSALFRVGDGGSNAGGAYSYGSTNSTERALGSLASGTVVSDVGVVISNNTGIPLTTVTITYTGEQWRRGNGSKNSLFFFYKVNATDISSAPNTPYDLLNFTVPSDTGIDAARNGNLAAFRTTMSQTFTLDSNWVPGQNLALRWQDIDDPNNATDDGMAIDDFSFSAAAPTAPTRQDSTITFTNVSTFTVTTNWLKGNGTGRIVKMNTTNSFTNPTNGSLQLANSNYSGAGEQVVYNGTGNSVNVSGLSTATQYFFRVYNYNGYGVSSTYDTSAAPGNPNSFTTVAAAPPTKLVITSINGGDPPAQNVPFYIVVRSFDGSNYPQNVTANTVTGLKRYAGTGTLGGTLSGTIAINTNTDTIFGITYSFPEFPVQIRDTVTSGNTLTAAISAEFEVIGVASHLTFLNVPGSALKNTVIGSFDVVAEKDDFFPDRNYVDTITISIFSGPGGGVITGTKKKAAVAGIATFNDFQFNLPGKYVLKAQATVQTYGLVSVKSDTIIITGIPSFREIVIPKYIGSKSSSGTNNSRTPIALCVRFDSLVPYTTYDIKAGLDTIAGLATSYGGGNLWTPLTTFATATQTDTIAFTTNGAGSSGPYWLFIQPTSSRFDAGQVHNLRLGYVVHGAGFPPSSPNFIGTKTIKALDIASTARTADTLDDGAFLKGSTSSCIDGKYILIYDNVNGTGDPMFAYQARQAIPTNSPQSDLPTTINDIYLQSGTSSLGDWPAVIPTGGNNPNGVRRVEARNADTTLFSFKTDADGNWPGGANTTTITRRSVGVLTLSDAGMNSVSISSISSTPVSCGGANNGTATVVATGTGTLSYSWNSSPVQTGATATGLDAGYYKVIVSDSKGCSATDSVLVGQPATSTISAGGPTTFCQGDSVTLSTGAGATQYTWYRNNIAIVGATLNTLKVKTAGTYFVIVKAGICTDTSLSVTVTVNTFGQNGTIFSESVGSPSGNTDISNYNGWQNTAPVSFSSTTSSESQARSSNSSSGYSGASGGGNIFFTFTGARNFIISGINTLSYTNLQMTFGFRRDQNFVAADSMFLEVSSDGILYDTLKIAQPSADNTWQLDTAVGTIPATANLRLRFSKNGGPNDNSFRVDDVKITGSTPAITIAVTGSTSVCASTGGVRLTSNILSNNHWHPNNETTQSILATTSGNYSVTSTGSTGCPSTSAPVSININPNPAVSITSFTNVSCFGDSNGVATALGSGGIGTLDYSWNTTPAQLTSTASNLKAGTYKVTVTDDSSCTAKDSVTITQPTQITVTAAANDSSVCPGDTITLFSFGTTTNQLTFTTSTPVAIPDLSAVTSSIVVSGVNTSSLLDGITNVKINSLTHTADTNLILRLIAPDGRSMILCNRRGGFGDNFINTAFSSSSGTAITSGSPPFSSTFMPDTTATAHDAYSRFDGVNPNGTWQLYVSDNAAGDIGTINSWSITFRNPMNFSWTSTPAGFSSTVKSPGTVTPSALVASGNVTYRVIATNPVTGCTDTSSVTVAVVPCGVTVKVHALIEAFYRGGGVMDTVLLIQGVTGAGNTETDTVTVELHGTTGDFSTNIVDSYKAVIDINGLVTGVMHVATPGTYYYLAITSRNAVRTFSADSILLALLNDYDFRLDPASAFGSNESNLFDGYYAVYSGDVNSDEFVTTEDVGLVDNDNIDFVQGIYVATDVNGDGFVTTADVGLTDNNNIAFIAVQHP